MHSEDPFVKVIVVGEPGVGKTCLLNQYCYNRFENATGPTIGCDFTIKMAKFGDKIVKLQLWDIAGQERYKSMSKMYIRGALGCVIVSDITDERSLHESVKWKELVDQNSDQVEGKPIPIILVQNKVDEVKQMGKLEDFQKLDHLERFSTDHGFVKCLQTSAKDNTNLTELFQQMLGIILQSGRLEAKGSGGNFPSNPKPPAPSKGGAEGSGGASSATADSQKFKIDDKTQKQGE